MTSLDDLRNNLPTPPPTGWNPGVQWDGNEGHITTAARTEEPTPDEVRDILKKSRLDPDKIIIDWTRQARITTQLDANGDLVQCWYKLPIMQKPERSYEVEDILDDLYDETDFRDDQGIGGNLQGISGKTDTGFGKWRTLQIGDTHIGKDLGNGGGSDVLATRWKESVSEAISDFKVYGGCHSKSYDGIHLAFLGDLIEGYTSQSGANIAGTDLTLSEQLRLARHLVSWTIQEVLKISDHVIVSAVPGNHGETTRVQKRPMADSHDIDIVAAVMEAFNLKGYESRITWYFPEPNAGHVTYEVGNTIFTSVHGHLFKGQMEGAKKWWAGMTVNNQAPAAAHILMAGHFHNFMCANYTKQKWIIFGAALETKSTWFFEKTGNSGLWGIVAYDTMSGKPTNITVI